MKSTELPDEVTSNADSAAQQSAGRTIEKLYSDAGSGSRVDHAFQRALRAGNEEHSILSGFSIAGMGMGMNHPDRTPADGGMPDYNHPFETITSGIHRAGESITRSIAGKTMHHAAVNVLNQIENLVCPETHINNKFGFGKDKDHRPKDIVTTGIDEFRQKPPGSNNGFGVWHHNSNESTYKHSLKTD